MLGNDRMEQPKKDIGEFSDIVTLVDRFYDEVRHDPLIGPVFEVQLGNHWEAHLDKMYRFWQGLLLDEHTYRGRPFPPHARLPIDIQHFERWLLLFHKTIDGLFAGEKAEEAKLRAVNIANVFYSKLMAFRASGGYPSGELPITRNP